MMKGNIAKESKTIEKENDNIKKKDRNYYELQMSSKYYKITEQKGNEGNKFSKFILYFRITEKDISSDSGAFQMRGENFWRH